MRQQKGQSLVEFAMTAVILLSLLLFIVDGGRILWNYVTVSNAARIGARYGIVHGAKSTSPAGPGSQGALTTFVRDSVVGLDPAALTITPSWTPNNAPGSKITVAVQYATRPVTAIFWPDQTLTLSARSTMVIQN